MQAMVMATKRVMVMVTATGMGEVAGDETGIGNGGKSNGNGNKVGGQARASRAMVRATVMQWQGPPRQQHSTSGAVGDNDRHHRGRRK